GQMDRFRVAPVTSMELLVGKYIAYAVLSLAVSAIVGVLLVGVLRIPLLGSIGMFIGIIMLLTFASLGFGLLISLVADSERQAVQLSMLMLLASVFFSGFVLPVSDFVQWMRYIAYALPVTHGISALQDLMLRGRVVDTWMLAALLGIGVVLYVGSLLRLRRVIGTAD
nr:ABC transporter permease [Chloroflexota bacterium]